MIRHKNQDAIERKLQQPLDSLSLCRYSLVYSASKAHRISETTLRARTKGRTTRVEARMNPQLFLDSEEKALEKWISQLTITGHPPRYTTHLYNEVSIYSARMAKYINTNV